MTKPLKLISVVGARPNFMKIAPLVRAIARHPERIEHRLIHTGQHYDKAMSHAFFDTLGIPAPDRDLGIGSGTHAEQVGRTMIAFEAVIKEWRPDWVIVVGDVNATCACAITARKEQVALAHIESGLRSFDMRMPEEINRLVTDRLANRLYTTDALADANLLREGVPADAIRQVGNIMIDTLDANRAAAERLDPAAFLAAHACPGARPFDAARLRGDYAVLTLHRPSNVDDPAQLARLTHLFVERIAATMPLVWSLHPRTQKQLREHGLLDRILGCPAICAVQPLGYLEMLRLNMGARVMLTDSGGLQEECCVLGTPCLTMRENTERPVTLVEHGGVSELTGADSARIGDAFERMRTRPRTPHRPPLWDGRTAERIVDDLLGDGMPVSAAQGDRT